jgi:CSLREA domain-containing protein
MRRNRLLPLFASSSIALFGVLAYAPRAMAATFTVNTTEDGTDATPGDAQCATEGGQCSLRAAIQEANMLPGPDTVRVPAGTYLIAREGENEDQCATGDLDITSSINIVGDGAATTIVDANHRDRVFDVLPTGAAVVSGVTVQNGSAEQGGGARVEGGTLKLVECTVTANQAADTGGGIDNDFGILEVERSTISGNVAHNTGGGVENSGTASFRNATVSGNTADVLGGGISNLGSATLNNSTVVTNTLTGVDNDGQLVFMNSLIANNAGPDCQGTLTSRGFNLIRIVDGCTFDGDTSGDLLNMDPALGPLADNGGPTFTHALLAGSAALDAANPTTPGSPDPACEATDQRGVTRPQGPRCDIGAYEACGTTGSAGGAQVDTCVSACGNGVVDSGEECDHGASNGKPGDTCDADCKVVPGSPGGAFPTCGDGHVDDGEECDDANHKDDDGCTSDCRLEEPIGGKCDDNPCDGGSCDCKERFRGVNCVLEKTVCNGEDLPFGVLKRIAKARDMLASSCQTDDSRRGKKLVKKAMKVLKKAEKIRAGVVRKGGLSDDCSAALIDMLGKAREQCRSWRDTF